MALSRGHGCRQHNDQEQDAEGNTESQLHTRGLYQIMVTKYEFLELP